MMDSSSIVLGPATGGSGARAPQRLTGTTSQSIGTALTPGTFATILVSSDVPIAFRLTGAASTAVATDPELPLSGRYDWSVEDGTQHVAVIAADGASTFECWVFQSSP
jgi:hypothetical protein